LKQKDFQTRPFCAERRRRRRREVEREFGGRNSTEKVRGKEGSDEGFREAKLESFSGRRLEKRSSLQEPLCESFFLELAAFRISFTRHCPKGVKEERKEKEREGGREERIVAERKSKGAKKRFGKETKRIVHTPHDDGHRGGGHISSSSSIHRPLSVTAW
jgi:hypothetical protein